MKRLYRLLAVILISGCIQHPPLVPLPRGQGGDVMDGYAVATTLQANYRNTAAHCGSASRPAFLCAGVLLRGTTESSAYRSYNPIPGRLGVSFSYLRKDANFNHLAVGLDNGFIFYPILSAPADKEHMQVLCSFPIDGNTWHREAPGCGQTDYFPTVSRRCQSQGITTAVQWKAHFDSLPAGYDRETWVYSYVCSFDVRDAMNELGADSFYQSLQAMHLVPSTLLHHYNEIVIQAWAQDIPTRLPIQAFFYTQANGLKGARHDQWDFFRHTGGMFIPIIHMTLPPLVTDEATFVYSPADQYCQPGATSCL
ncbi:MAG TPA: halovibrin HvnA [Pseudomonas sp.]|uniref:halovibrin HvnA n=1 Tax=Pseudomonas sp. TaxID=306 RepID=UPI002ED8BC22